MNTPYGTLLGARSWRNRMLTSERAGQDQSKTLSSGVSNSSRSYGSNATAVLDLLENLRRGFSGLRLAK